MTVTPALTTRGLLLVLALLAAGCGQPFQPVATPPPNLLGTYVGTWGGAPTTFAIQSSGAAPPTSGLFLGSLSVGGVSQMQVSGVITHPSPQGPRESTFTAQVGYIGGELILALSLPTMDSMDTFEELSLAMKGNTLIGEAQRNYLQGPKGPIRLVRQSTPPR
jgi:hypothetical protein